MPSFRKLTMADNHPLANILFAQLESERSDDATEDVDPFNYSSSSDLEQDSEFDDQDDPWDEDITLRPKTAIQRSKPSSRQRRRQRSSAVAKPPSIPLRAIPLTSMASKPLNFPLEILEMVCHYLSQATLRFSASLVSRRWNVVCNPFIRRMVMWKALSSDYDQFVLDTLRDVNSLECWLHQDPDVEADNLPHMQIGFRQNGWENFWPRLLNPIKQGDRSTIDSNTSSVDNNSDYNLCLMNTIRHLRLFCEPSSKPVSYLHRLQPHFLSLRTLEIRIFGNPIGKCAIFTLLDDSPQLKQLKINVTFHRQWNLVAGDHEDDIIDPPEPEIDPDTAHFPVRPKIIIPPNKSYPQRYKLEVFDVSRVSVHQRVLERLISTCPELRILKVFEANERQWTANHGYVNLAVNHERLFDHAKECCPRLESIEFTPRLTEPNDPTHLVRTAKFFPDASMLTLNCGGYMPDAPGLEARRLLSQITFLEIRLADQVSCLTSHVDRILCLTPRLLHLISKEHNLECQGLKFLPEPAEEPVPPQFITHNRTRKNTVREERRARRRESLLAIEQAAERARAAREATGRSSLPEIPLYWQCHDLRTLDLNTYNVCKLAEYVSQHQLFQKLTSLKLRVASLNVGQYQQIPDCKKLPSGDKAKGKGAGQKGGRTSAAVTTIIAATNATTTTTTTGTTHPGFSPKAVIPARYANDLENLQDLPSLEQLVIYVHALYGMIHHSDFEFLRRHATPVGDPASSSSAASSSPSPLLSSTPTPVVWTEDMVTFSPAEAKCIETEGANAGLREGEEKGQGVPSTCWPRLQMFKIRYGVSALQTDYSKVVAGMERIRPGVEFQIKMMPRHMMNYI